MKTRTYALVALVVGFLLAAACAHPRPPSGGGGAPRLHTLRLVGLAKDGRALIEEREVLTPPSRPRLRYHFSTPDGAVSVLEERRCEVVAQCESAPVDVAALGLEPPERFLRVDSSLPVRAGLVLAPLGALEVRVAHDRGEVSPEGPQLRVLHPGPPEASVEVWHLPGTEATRAALYVAGPWLFAELSLTGPLQRVVRAVDLRAAGAQLLEQQALQLLAQGRPGPAKERLEQATRLQGTRASLFFQLARAHARLGRLEEAMAALREALAKDPRALPAQARSEPDLAPLRAREDFRELMAPKGLEATP